MRRDLIKVMLFFSLLAVPFMSAGSLHSVSREPDPNPNFVAAPSRADPGSLLDKEPIYMPSPISIPEKGDLYIQYETVTREYTSKNMDVTLKATVQRKDGQVPTDFTVVATVSGTNAGSYKPTIKFKDLNGKDTTVSANLWYSGPGLVIIPSTRPVTVSARNASKSFSQEDPDFGFSVTGAFDGDESIVVSVTRNAGNNVGTYTITPSVTAQNYSNVRIVPATFTIYPEAVYEYIGDVPDWVPSPPAMETLAFSKTYFVPASPKADDLKFSGWTTGDVAISEGGSYELDPDSQINQVVFRGEWYNAFYRITYLVDGKPYATMDIPPGDPIIAPNIPPKGSLEFLGWNGLPEKMPPRDITVTGHFSEEDASLNQASSKGWTLSNVLLLAIGLAGALVLALAAVLARNPRPTTLLPLLGTPLGCAVVFASSDFTGKMAHVDRLTPFCALLFAMQVFAIVVCGRIVMPKGGELPPKSGEAVMPDGHETLDSESVPTPPQPATPDGPVVGPNAMVTGSIGFAGMADAPESQAPIPSPANDVIISDDWRTITQPLPEIRFIRNRLKKPRTPEPYLPLIKRIKIRRRISW